MKIYEELEMLFWLCDDIVCESGREDLDDPNVDDDGWTGNY